MRFKHRTLTNQKIVLDHNEFLSCTFKRCHIVYSATGPVTLAYNRFDRCTWELTGPAGKTISFMAQLYAMGGGGRALTEATIEAITHTSYLLPGSPTIN